jgi:transposase
MLYVREPSREEVKELRRMVRQEVGRVSQRAQMVLLSSRGHRVPEIASLFELCQATVRFWLRRFDTHGPSGLYDRPRSGRPAKVNEEVTGRIQQMMQEGPQQAGYQATYWTVAMLVSALADDLKVTFSRSGIRNALHKIGLRWGRPRLGMPDKTDPEKAEKQWLITHAVVTAPPEAVILHADESRLHLLPLVRAMWHWVGQQIRIPTPGSNVTRALFGALNIRSGQWTYLIRERMRKEDFIAFLEHLLVVYPHVPIILIVDNYSSHTARLVRDWLAGHQRLRLYYLPKYCSHLNPVEGIWRQLKSRIAANRLYGSMQALLQAVDCLFAEMTPQRALAWASIARPYPTSAATLGQAAAA